MLDLRELNIVFLYKLNLPFSSNISRNSRSSSYSFWKSIILISFWSNCFLVEFFDEIWGSKITFSFLVEVVVEGVGWLSKKSKGNNLFFWSEGRTILYIQTIKELHKTKYTFFVVLGTKETKNALYHYA